MTFLYNPHAFYIPLKRGQKLPSVKQWQMSAVDSVTEVEAFKAKANGIGAVPKPGYFVLDIDVKGEDNALEWLQNNRPALPKTWNATTPSGGQHHWFKLPEGMTVSNKQGLKSHKNLDIRAAGKGFVVFDATINGANYEQFPADIVEAPKWLLEDIEATPTRDKFSDDGSAVLEYKGAVIQEYRKALDLANEVYSTNSGESWDGTATSLAWYTAHMYYHGEDKTSVYLEHDLVLDLDSETPGRGSDKLHRALELLGDHYATAEEHKRERDTEFWNSTPVLKRIKACAVEGSASEWAVLGNALGIVASTTSANVRTDSRIKGDPGSLNLFIASTATPGQGKGQAWKAANNLFQWPEYRTTNIGSGEALLMELNKSEVILDADGEPLEDDQPPARSVFNRSGEIGEMGAKAGRQGSTMWEVLKSAYSGEALKSSTVTGKSDADIEADTYRVVLSVDVQPLKSDILFDHGDSGLPQRFLWIDAKPPTKPMNPRDRQAKTARPEAPEWVNPFGTYNNSLIEIALPDVALDDAYAVDLAIWERSESDPDEGDTHTMFTQIKVASLLAILHGEKSVSPDMWEIACTLMAHSNQRKESCKSLIIAEAERKAIERATNDAKRERHKATAIAELSQEDMPVSQFAQEVVLPKIEETGTFSKSDIGQKVRSNLRPKWRDAIAFLTSEKLITEVKDGRKTSYELAS